MTHPLAKRIGEGPVLVDGACGTMLYAAGVPLEACFDEVNLSRPDLVAGVHRAYIAAGADVIETNTFGANRAKLENFGLGKKVREINRRAVKIAREEREISGKPVLIAGSVGPTMRTMAPIGTTQRDEIVEIYAEQMDALLEGGVDVLFVETIGGLTEMTAAIEALKSLPREPKSVVLHSDSQLLIKTMTLGWKRKKNHDLWVQLDEFCSLHRITWEWVRGHHGHVENERCDRLAQCAAKAAR